MFIKVLKLDEGNPVKYIGQKTVDNLLQQALVTGTVDEWCKILESIRNLTL